MDSSWFENFVHKIASTVIDGHEENMGNAIHHNQYREDILSSGFL